MVELRESMHHYTDLKRGFLWLSLSIIREQMRTNSGEDVGKKETSFTVDGSVNSDSPFGKWRGSFSKCQKLTYLPTLPCHSWTDIR